MADLHDARLLIASVMLGVWRRQVSFLSQCSSTKARERRTGTFGPGGWKSLQSEARGGSAHVAHSWPSAPHGMELLKGLTYGCRGQQRSCSS